MKKNILLVSLLSIFALAACKKVSNEDVTPTLDVEEKNSVLIAKHTWTGCGPCGGWGFEQFESLVANNPEHVAVAFTMGNLGGYGNQAIYDHFQNAFEIPNATPTFHYNLVAGSSVSAAEQEMDAEGVIANSNYEMKREGDKIILSTTTKFFQDVVGEFSLAPYLVLDGIIANQSGHPDGANTEHHKVAVGIAKPTTVSTSDYNGYVVASGSIREGYTVNLEFEIEDNANWETEDISFALMILKNNGDGSYKLINTFSK